MKSNTTLRLGQPTLAQRMIVSATTAMAAVSAMVSPVFAAEAMEQGVTKGMYQLYQTFQKIMLPIAVIGLVICLLSMLFGGQKGMEKGKQYILVIVLVVAGVYLAPLIVETISGWFKNVGEGTIFSGVSGS